MPMDVQLQIVNMIKNWQSVEEDRFNSDSIFDFVTEHMAERNVLKFKDVGSILRWLCDGNGVYYGVKKTAMKTKRQQPTAKRPTFKPGQKIQIRKPNGNVQTFNDIHGALAVLKQNNNSNQSNSGDSEEIDVTTLDNHSSPWNTYAMAHHENRQLLNVLTEIHPIASATQQRTAAKHPKAKPKRKRSKSPDENKKEPQFWCNHCDKKYQQNSSLIRHHKEQHATEITVRRPRNKKLPHSEL